MRGRRRGLGLGLGNYTLGDRYTTPDRRLSQMLMLQGFGGGPSGSWQESTGRIARQLLGAYLGNLDQEQLDVANRTFATVEPDSWSMQPTVDDQQIMESETVQDILRQKTDADRMSNPMIQRNINAIGREQDRIADRRNYLTTLQNTASRNRFTDGVEGRVLGQVQGPLTDKYSSDAIDKATQNIEGYGGEFNRTMGRLKSQEPTDDEKAEAVRRELIGQRKAREVKTLNEKMPPLEFALQNLKKLKNNPYALRLAQQIRMNQMNTDAALRLAEVARDQKLDDDLRKRGYEVEDRDIRIGATAPKSQEISLPDGMTQRQIYVNGTWVNDGGPYDKNLMSKAAQEQAVGRKTYFDPEVYKKKETIKAEAKGDSYTDAQNKASGFYSRMLSANKAMEGVLAGADGLQGTVDYVKYDDVNSLEQTMLNAVPLFGNKWISNQRQQLQQAQENWVSAVLRRESGAVLGDEEIVRENKKYFPQYGDSKETIAQKSLARKEAEKGMLQSSGGAWEAQQKNNANKGRRSGDFNNVTPEGFTDSEWGRLTPAEQAEYNGGN